MKIAPAVPEEHAFAAEVNKLLLGSGAAVHAFSVVDGEDASRRYGLTFQCGARRHTVNADCPFHYDAAEDVVARVREWMAAVTAGQRWTTNLEAADGEA